MKEGNSVLFSYQICSPVGKQALGTLIRALKILVGFLGSIGQNMS